MEEKKLTEQESMELITSMIASTKQHLSKGEGNILLFWGYLCVIVALAAGISMRMSIINGTYMEFFHYERLIWWLIPIIGIPYTLIVKRRNAKLRNVVTYTDKLSISLWNYVLWLAVATAIIGAFFFISGFPVWRVLKVFAFFVVGMAVSVQGMIIKEKSMIWGGAFSVMSGGILEVGKTVTPLIGMFTMPLLIISFIVMLIIPGYIINYKAKHE